MYPNPTLVVQLSSNYRSDALDRAAHRRLVERGRQGRPDAGPNLRGAQGRAGPVRRVRLARTS